MTNQNTINLKNPSVRIKGQISYQEAVDLGLKLGDIYQLGDHKGTWKLIYFNCLDHHNPFNGDVELGFEFYSDEVMREVDND